MTDARVREGPINGVFWLADNMPVKLPGRLDLGQPWPRLELVGELTPSLRLIETSSEGVQRWGPTPMGDEELTIHGNLAGVLGRVTLIGAWTRRRSSSGGMHEQVLEARYAVLGEHVEGPKRRFSKARFRMYGLEEWAALPGLSVTMPDSGTPITVEYAAPDAIEYVLESMDAKIAFATAWTFPTPTWHGANLSTETWATWERGGGDTVDSLVQTAVTPMQSLLTLVALQDSGLRRLQVEGRQGNWLDVYGPFLSPPSRPEKKPVDELLLSLEDLGAAGLGRWMQGHASLSPIPQIVAGSLAAAGTTVENQLLELAAAAEGLHRRLHPADRRLSEGDVQEGLARLEDLPEIAAVPILKEALRVYLFEPSYPQRLKALLAGVSDAAPGVAGRQNRWVKQVVNARVGFAHARVTNTGGEDSALAHLVLARSLRWVLTIRMFLETGVRIDLLARKVADSPAFRNFMRSAQDGLPSVYGPHEAKDGDYPS
jgi:ApeA N-terminal domain 1